MKSASARGFTLVELLLATALLASGIALAFATVRAVTAVATRSDLQARRNERVRAVEEFLRHRLEAARPVPFAVDERTGLPLRFLGNEKQMVFVADLPDYLGRGGPHLHRFSIVGAPGEQRVDVAFQLVQGGVAVRQAQPLPPEQLAGDLQEVRFRYRALDRNRRLGEWQATWEVPEAMPLQVEVRVRDSDGTAWPPLVVALPLAGNHVRPGAGR